MPKGIKGFQKGHKVNEGKPVSENTRQKIAKGNKGKVRTQEMRIKISESNKGKVITPEQRLKISQTMKERGIKPKKRVWSEAEKQKTRLSHKGEKNYLWKGEDVSVIGKHKWLSVWYGKPKECEHCGIKGKTKKGQWTIQWANKDHKYKRAREEFIPLCRKCHDLHDKPLKNKARNLY